MLAESVEPPCDRTASAMRPACDLSLRHLRDELTENPAIERGPSETAVDAEGLR